MTKEERAVLREAKRFFRSAYVGEATKYYAARDALLGTVAALLKSERPTTPKPKRKR